MRRTALARPAPLAAAAAAPLVTAVMVVLTLPSAAAAAPGGREPRVSDAPWRIGSNLGAMHYCSSRYGNDRGLRFDALARLAAEARAGLSAANRRRADQARAAVERQGRWYGRPLSFEECGRVREQFLDHYR